MSQQVYKGFTLRTWERGWLRRWAWEVCSGDARIACGERLTDAEAMYAAREKVDELARQNVPALADRKGVA